MRKPAILFTLVMLTAFASKGQQYAFSLNNGEQGKEYYLNGTQLVELGRYKEADSLLTLALCSYKNEDVYYNRAISRLYNYDTTGSCEDLNIAANKYFDNDARHQFNMLCCSRVDSIYYDKKYSETTAGDSRYLEEIQHIKISGEIVGVIHELNVKHPSLCLDYGCTDAILGIRGIPTDVIAAYKLIDSKKNFMITPELPLVQKISQYNKLKEKAGSYYAVKYKTLKELNRAEKLSIYYQIRISAKGEVIDGKFLNVSPEVSIAGYEQDLENDVQDIISRYPKVKPARFMGENVSFISYDVIDF